MSIAPVGNLRSKLPTVGGEKPTLDALRAAGQRRERVQHGAGEPGVLACAPLLTSRVGEVVEHVVTALSVDLHGNAGVRLSSASQYTGTFRTCCCDSIFRSQYAAKSDDILHPRACNVRADGGHQRQG